MPILRGSISSEFPFFDLNAEHIINISDKDSEIIQQSFRDIINEYKRISPEKDYLLRSYIYILLLRIREIYNPNINKINAGLTRSEKLSNNFKHLVEKNIISIRRVQDYAEKLHISPNYLSDIVHETFGKSPRDIINDMLMLEIKVQLGATDKSVSEIAYSLNFTDQAHLNHFMKLHTGLTPLEYREMFESDKEEARFLSYRTSG
ncbi:MAG: helix-turn-helix domain-containing protein [Ignavibacteriaceae bacterium]